MLPIIAALCWWDGVTATMSGSLRGAGRQVMGAVMHAGGYWVVGLPLAALFGWSMNMGVAGLWSGILIGAAVQAAVIFNIILRWDWNHEVKRAQRLVGQGKFA